MKKAIVYLLITSTLLSIVSCAKSGTGGETSDGNLQKNTETTAYEILPDLPDEDYNGYTFTFYMRQDKIGIMNSGEETGETMNDAIYQRNARVTDRFNVTFAAVACADAYAADAKNTILAGEDAYDVIIPHARFAFAYAQEGLALDWLTELPYVDLDAGWWAKDARDSFKIKDRLYTMTGDVSYDNFSSTKVMYFNKKIFDTYGWDYPYQTVLDGDWTFARLNELALASVKDLNGDSAYKFEDDSFGFATTWWGTPINILFTADQRICKKNADGEIVLSLNTERTVEVFEKFFDFMSKDGCYIHLNDDSAPVVQAFREGRLTFIEATLGTASSLRDMNDDFGIIPSPKFDSGVKNYITGVDAACNLLVVPITAGDRERTSAILEALAYEGWKSVIPTYYDVALSTKYARDEESVLMLDIIRGARIYDIGYFSGDVPMTMSSIGWQLCKTADHNFSSYYAANEAAALTQIAKINAFYSD